MSSLLVNLTSVLPSPCAPQDTTLDKKSIQQSRKDTISFLSKLSDVHEETGKVKDKILDEFKNEVGIERFFDIAPALSRMNIIELIRVADNEYIIRRREKLYNLDMTDIKAITKRIRKGFYDPSFGV